MFTTSLAIGCELLAAQADARHADDSERIALFRADHQTDPQARALDQSIAALCGAKRDRAVRRIRELLAQLGQHTAAAA